MSNEGYADPVMNDGPGFHLIIPVSELTERVTRARVVEASDVSSAPPVVRNHRRGNAQNSNQPLPSPTWLRGSRHPKTPRLRLGPRPRLTQIPRHTRCLDPRVRFDPSAAPDARIREPRLT